MEVKKVVYTPVDIKAVSIELPNIEDLQYARKYILALHIWLMSYRYRGTQPVDRHEVTQADVNQFAVHDSPGGRWIRPVMRFKDESDCLKPGDRFEWGFPYAKPYTWLVINTGTALCDEYIRTSELWF